MNDHAARCRDVRDLIDLFVSEDLEPREADAVRLHMGRCEACRDEADACRRQRERLASMSSAQMPSQVSPFFWQGIQREILMSDRKSGEAAEPAAAARGRRTALRPIVYALAALVLVAVTVIAAAAFLGGAGAPPAVPRDGIVHGGADLPVETIPQEVPFFSEGGLAPAGAPEGEKEIEL
ncbi:MAG TPA: hypothetical protein DCM87_18690 [Planctomycetes bacterium]|nr:hypothetical protein [Planctomycetota bacterium]